jgi:hypothetical protein
MRPERLRPFSNGATISTHLPGQPPRKREARFGPAIRSQPFLAIVDGVGVPQDIRARTTTLDLYCDNVASGQHLSV